MAPNTKQPLTSVVCNGLDFLFGKIVLALSRFDLGKTINIFRIDPSCVWLDMSGRYKLYGIKIEGSDNTIKHFGTQMGRVIQQLRYADNSEVTIFFVKRGIRQAVYLFAFDHRIIGQLSREFNIPHLKGDEIASSLLDIMHSQQYRVEKNRLIRSGVAETPFVPYGLEMASGKFRDRAMAAVDNIMRDFTLYQGEGYGSIGDFNPIHLFQIDWEGTFGLWVNFSSKALEGKIRQYEKTAKFADKVFARECANILKKDDAEFSKFLEEESLLVNSFLFLKDETSLPQLQDVLNIQFNKNYLTGPSVLSQTLMLCRDSSFDAILPKETVLKYLTSSHKAATPLEYKCDFYGTDISGNFVEYALANNNNPHCLLTGQTGAGKSLKVMQILEKIVGYDHAKKIAERIHEQRINFVDVGYTSGNMMSELKNAHPDDVEIFGSDVSALRFGLFDFELQSNGKVSDEEKNFLASFISFALEVDGEKPLTGLERDALDTSVEEMLKESQYNDMFIDHLIDNGGYKKIVQELLDAGFSDNTKLRDLPEKYNFLKKRTLNDLLNLVSVKQSSSSLSKDEQDIYSKLALKLRALKSNNMINLVPNTQMASDKQIFHIDLQSIKNDKRSFMLSYWMLMKSWLKQLEARALPYFARGEQPETTYFFIEEAHNFFQYESFAIMLKTTSKEIRKFGGRLFFISQDPSDIPPVIYNELGTKMFVVTISERERFKKLAALIYEQKNMEPINQIIDKMEDRALLILGKHGAISCSMKLTRELEFYKPNKIA
ncbi:MAG: hypothetical protein PHT07_09990 [Paludibacter sp.]|nr:hypothetical protein [Paludibacter sp.]